MWIYTKTIYHMWIKQEVYKLFSAGFFCQYRDVIRTAFATSSIRKRENTIKEIKEVFSSFLRKKSLKKLGLLKTKLFIILKLIIQSYSMLKA